MFNYYLRDGPEGMNLVFQMGLIQNF